MIINNKYFLRSDATADEVYECLTVFMDECNACAQKNIAHRKLEIVDNDGFSRWMKHEKENDYNLMEFTCVKTTRDSELDLKVWFNLNVTDAGKGKVHLLVVECKEKNNEEKIIRFFSKLERLVPKAYKQTGLKSAYTEMIRNEKDSEHGNFYIEFKSDKEKKFFFDKSYINSLVKDLWFMGVDFQESSYDDYIRKYKQNMAPELRMTKGNHFTSSNSKAFFQFMEKKRIEDYAKKSFDEESQIIIQEREHDKTVIIGKDDGINSYEELKAKVIFSVEKIKDEIRAEYGEKFLMTWTGLLNYQQEENEEENSDSKVMLEIQKDMNAKLKEEIQKLTELYNNSQAQLESLKEENPKLSEDLYAERSERMNLTKKMESLSSNESEKQMFDYISLEEKYNKAMKTVEHLQNSLSEMQSKKLDEQNNGNAGYIDLKVPCTLKNLFSDEIQDYLYKVLYEACELKHKLLPENEKVEVTRHRDVLEDILKNKIFNDVKCNTKGLINRVFNAVKDIKKIDIASLKAEGFVFERNNNHYVSYFRDERYEVVFPSTGQDSKHGSENLFKDISNRIFMF